MNQKHHLNRQRFTIAHELGHYFLHQDKLSNGIIDELNREDGVNNQIEFDANEFGANLLMPELIFRQYWEENYSVKNMADNFSVSESAIITRARFLGLFSRDDYGYFV